MKNLFMTAAAAVTLAFAAPAIAQDEAPLKAGEYVEVTGIHVNDGASLKYASHIADSWMMANEYAKQQGWISDYEALVNVHPREGEPNVYLIVRFAEFETVEESESRGEQYREYVQRSMTQLQSESGDRAEYRTIGGTTLLRKYTKR